jgi:hypothetical protein
MGRLLYAFAWLVALTAIVQAVQTRRLRAEDFPTVPAATFKEFQDAWWTACTVFWMVIVVQWVVGSLLHAWRGQPGAHPGEDAFFSLAVALGGAWPSGAKALRLKKELGVDLRRPATADPGHEESAD